MNPSPQPIHLVVWHTEGTAISGLLSWMWRLKQSLPRAGIQLTLASLEIQPFRFPQVCEIGELYDARVKTAQGFVAFLKKHMGSIHLINHAFEYLDLLEKMSPTLLDRLKLVGICHTDQACYYEELTRFSPRLSGIIAVSARCAETLEKRLENFAGKIPVLPSWDIPIPPKLERKVNWKDPLRVIFNGRLIQTQKRVFDLPLITRKLNEKGVRVALSIVGDGPDRAELMRQFEPSDCVSVNYLGQKAPSEVQKLLAQHDVFLQVSEFEGASVSLMEAMIAGLVPVVTATASGVDLLANRKNALLAQVGNIGEIAGHVAELNADRHGMAGLGARAFETGESALKELKYSTRLREYLTPLMVQPNSFENRPLI